MTDVFRRPIRIFRWHVTRDDAVLEAGRLERGLPVEDRLADPGLPLIRGVRIDIVHDRLFRIAEISFAAIRALEAIPRDVPLRARDLLIGAEVSRLDGEETDALVGVARHHRLLGQLHDAPVPDDALCAWRRCSACTTATTTAAGGAWRARLRRFDFDVLRERNC